MVETPVVFEGVRAAVVVTGFTCLHVGPGDRDRDPERRVGDERDAPSHAEAPVPATLPWALRTTVYFTPSTDAGADPPCRRRAGAGW